MSSTLTFDHDHVDVDGADGGLRQPLSSLQHRGDLTGRDAVIRFGAESHQLPHCHTCRRQIAKTDSLVEVASTTKSKERQLSEICTKVVENKRKLFQNQRPVLN